MSVLSKIVSYSLFVFFVGAVLGCSFTIISSHLGIFTSGMASAAVDPLKGGVPVSEMKLMAVLAAISLAVVIFWRLIQTQHHLLLSNNILERWHLRLQAVLVRLHDHLLTALRRGILQPNIY